MLLAALRLVEPDQHRRVLAGIREQFQPVARGEPAEQFVLPPHVIGVAHLFKAGGKMAVPEQHHFFLKRPRPFGHAIQPPAAQFHEALKLKPLLLLLTFAGAPPASPFGPHPAGVDFPPDRGLPNRGGSWGRECSRSRATKKPPCPGRAGQLLDFGRRPAESSPVQQMRRRLIIPAVG